jgi:hypothetical protein
MKCSLCERYYNQDEQSPVCPHELIEPPKPLPGGVRLRQEIRNQLEEAFELRQRSELEHISRTHGSFAARVYAQHLIRRLEDILAQEKENANTV